MKAKLLTSVVICILLMGCRNHDKSNITGYQGISDTVVSEKGYYFIDHYYYNYTKEDGKNMQYNLPIWGYYDYESNKSIILCSRVDCNHKGLDCEAVFDNYNYSFQSDDGVWEIHEQEPFVYYKKRLYTLTYDMKAGVRVVSYNKDGFDMKVEKVLSTDTTYTGVHIINIYNGNIQYSLEKYKKNTDGTYVYTTYVYSTNMKNDEVLLCGEITSEDGVYLLPSRGVNGELYLSGFGAGFRDGKTKYVGYRVYDDRVEKIFDESMLDIDSASISQLLMLDDDRLLICYNNEEANVKGEVIIYKLSDNSITNIPNGSEVSITDKIHYDEKYIYLYTMNGNHLYIVDNSSYDLIECYEITGSRIKFFVDAKTFNLIGDGFKASLNKDDIGTSAAKWKIYHTDGITEKEALESIVKEATAN